VADAIWLQLRLKRLGRNTIGMNTNEQDSDGATRVAYILGVPLAENVVRQWPQMNEVVRTSKLRLLSQPGGFEGLRAFTKHLGPDNFCPAKRRNLPPMPLNRGSATGGTAPLSHPKEDLVARIEDLAGFDRHRFERSHPRAQPAPRLLSAISPGVRRLGADYQLEVVVEQPDRAEVSVGVLLKRGPESLDVLLRHRPRSISLQGSARQASRSSIHGMSS
jgi:hypothetical protein